MPEICWPALHEARELVDEHWGPVDAVTLALNQRLRLSADEIGRIVAEAPAARNPWRLRLNGDHCACADCSGAGLVPWKFANYLPEGGEGVAPFSHATRRSRSPHAAVALGLSKMSTAESSLAASALCKPGRPQGDPTLR